jgi:hypothetical protein
MNLKRILTIAIDFDGTCVTHEFPKVGKDIGAVPVLKKIIGAGHRIILYTMRAKPMKDGDIDTEKDAIDWFKSNGIPLYGVNNNSGQSNWTKSKKIHADLYIDDASLGAPLKTDESISQRPYYDWELAEKLLKDRGVI